MNKTSRSFLFAAAASGALLASSAATAIGAPHARVATTSSPQLTVKMSGKHSLDVTVPKRLTAGRVNVKLVAGKGEQAFDVLRLRGSYTINDFGDDLAEFNASEQQGQPTPDALKAFNRLVRHTVFCGGLDSGTGHKTVTGNIALPTAATYYVVNDSQGPDLDAPVVKLHVTASATRRPAPSADVVQKATNKKRFHGPTNLPASGSVKFDNAATNSPHQMFLQHVKTGTTRKQMIKALESNGPGPFRAGGVGVDVANPGHSVTVDYTLPAGDYAELCFFPDLQTGMPHAFMGMVRIVHLS
jgi:hypothetical protein